MQNFTATGNPGHPLLPILLSSSPLGEFPNAPEWVTAPDRAPSRRLARATGPFRFMRAMGLHFDASFSRQGLYNARKLHLGTITAKSNDD
jgi:hypothetical protein